MIYKNHVVIAVIARDEVPKHNSVASLTISCENNGIASAYGLAMTGYKMPFITYVSPTVIANPMKDLD